MDIAGYTGNISVTATGHTCQRWDTESPHYPNYVASEFPDATLDEASNYCRVADEHWAWCYTTNPDERFEYCRLTDIPCCEHWEYHHITCSRLIYAVEHWVYCYTFSTEKLIYKAEAQIASLDNNQNIGEFECHTKMWNKLIYILGIFQINHKQTYQCENQRTIYNAVCFANFSQPLVCWTWGQEFPLSRSERSYQRWCGLSALGRTNPTRTRLHRSQVLSRCYRWRGR